MQLSLFNVNGQIGQGAYEQPDFPAATDLVKHLDYLEIDRSLVWHVAARDLNPLIGNRSLLREIAEAGLEERLIPAFIITPACFYEDNSLDFLRHHCRSGLVRALRITPEVSRFAIREIERVLEQLAEFAPAVFWDCRYDSSGLAFRDLEYLAGRFPGISFVLTQKMWGGFGTVIDLMWRCPNVNVDNSWLHMRDTLELLSDNFGAERVLFGIGYQAHYGAAIAALAHARLTDSQRQMIAHGNLERILQIDPLPVRLFKPSSLLKQKPRWQVFRLGQPVRNTEIIDAHGHTPPHTRGWYIRRQDLAGSVDDFIRRMDELGVDRLIISAEAALFAESLSGNQQAEQVFGPYRDRFSGYLVFNPLYAAAMQPEFDNFFQRGFFVGFKLLPSYWKVPVTDTAYQPVWDYAQDHRLPILLHTWDDKYNSPAMLEDVVQTHPQAYFILGHAGGGTVGRLEAEALARQYSNVYLEFCGSFTSNRRFEQSLRLVGGNRVLFGSDTGAHDLAWELGRYLSMPLPDQELEPGLADNLRQIMRLPESTDYGLQ